jgi:glycosyltransferase A (GT-A) superfamily protein (DUF2064 family)
VSSGWSGAAGRRRLIIFTKEPAPGRVKTRLARTIGEAAAVELAWAFIEDTLELAAAAAGAVDAVLEVWSAADGPGGPGPRLEALVAGAGATAHAQGEGDLGRRLRRALDADPAAARVVLGTDAPDLPSDLVTAAFAGVEAQGAPPVLLGPAADGGYHLLALAAHVAAAPLEAPIAWSSPRALEDTRAAFTAAGVRAGNGAAWPDVDDGDGLEALRSRLRDTRDPRVARRTRAALGDGFGEAS